MSKEKKGRKIGRNKKHQSVAYKASGRKERNAKRRMRRTLRDQPTNLKLVAAYEKRFGAYQGEPSARARRKARFTRDMRRAQRAKAATPKIEGEQA